MVGQPDLPPPDRGSKGQEPERIFGGAKGKEAERFPDLDRQSHLLLDLPDEGGLGGFPRLDFPPGEFPETPEAAPRLAPGHENLGPVFDDRGRDLPHAFSPRDDFNNNPAPAQRRSHPPRAPSLSPEGGFARIAPDMRVAFLASEAGPYAKTGGLADVAGSLPKHLAKAGAEVKVFMPLYREVRSKGLPLLRASADLSFDWHDGPAVFSVWEEPTAKATVYFIEKNDYFERDGLYGPPSGDFLDNGERFAFFSRAVLESLRVLDFSPDVLHLHDWQTALVPAYLKFVYAEDPFFRKAKTLFTIHNLAYQGLFDREILGRIGLPPRLFHPEALEFYGRVSFLKAGLLYASALSTVSPKYSREIQTPEFGCGLDGLLRMRSGVLTGILNGADYAAWNPAGDAALARTYSAEDLDGKAACKSALLSAFGLPPLPRDLPVFGLVSRLAQQKGLDILLEAAGGLFGLGLRLVLLGQGEAGIEDGLKAAAARYPSFFGLRIAFDDGLARRIFAGSDMVLIPSRYEPCGLTQMYALKYGAVPVVRATGGLDDTIQEYDPKTGAGNGLKFAEAEPSAMIKSVRRAIALYSRKTDWMTLVRNGMACDFSWDKPAAEYLALYRALA